MKKTYMTPKLLITAINDRLMQVSPNSTNTGYEIDIDSDGTGDGSDAAAKPITLDFESYDDEDDI